MDFEITTTLSKKDLKNLGGYDLTDREWEIMIYQITNSNNGHYQNTITRDTKQRMYKTCVDIFDNIFYESTIRNVKNGVDIPPLSEEE